MKAGVKKEALLRAAKELNDVLDLTPKLALSEKEGVEAFKLDIAEASQHLTKDDKVSKETLTVVNSLKKEEKKKEKRQKKKTEKKEGKKSANLVIDDTLRKGATLTNIIDVMEAAFPERKKDRIRKKVLWHLKVLKDKIITTENGLYKLK